MRRYFLIVIFFQTLILTGCITEDINSVLRCQEDHEIRIRILEEKCFQINENTKAVQAIVEAYQSGKDYITNIEETAGGYRVFFAKAGEFSIYHGQKGEQGDQGEDGQDGMGGANGIDGLDAPLIGVQKHSDGSYYWTQTLDGATSWLRGTEGEMLRVTGDKGGQGEAGDDGEQGMAGVTPVLGVNADGYWTIDGKILFDTKGQPVHATGLQGDKGDKGSQGEPGTDVGGDQIIEKVEVLADVVKFTFIKDHETFTIPRLTKPYIEFVDRGIHSFYFGETQTMLLDYSGVTGLSAIAPAGWNVQIDLKRKRIVVTAPGEKDPYGEKNGEISLITSNAIGQSITISIPVNAVKAYRIDKWVLTESAVCNILNSDGVKIAEVCLEYIPGYAEDEQATVVYPFNSYQKKYGKGFVLSGGGEVGHDGYNYAGPGKGGPAYSEVFVTLSGITEKLIPESEPTVFEADFLIDSEGNRYPVTKISSLYWMMENYRCVHFTDGTPMATYSDVKQWLAGSKREEALWSYCDNRAVLKKIYGCYYNGYAVFSDKFIPRGWRLPTSDFLSGENDYQDMVDFFGGKNGSKLKSTRYGNNVDAGDWLIVSNGEPGTNLSGFTGVPGGVRIGEEDRSFGEFGYWWTSSPSNRSNGAFNTMDLRNYMETAVLPGAPSLSMEWAGCVRFVKDL